MTGNKEHSRSIKPANVEVVNALYKSTEDMANYIANDRIKEKIFLYPQELGDFLVKQTDNYFHILNDELAKLYKMLNKDNPEKIIELYSNLKTIEKTWGTALHYVYLVKK